VARLLARKIKRKVKRKLGVNIVTRIREKIVILPRKSPGVRKKVIIESRLRVKEDWD
jgi:hypothetical protein